MKSKGNINQEDLNSQTPPIIGDGVLLPDSQAGGAPSKPAEPAKLTLSQGIESGVLEALQTLGAKITAQRLAAQTHSALIVSGWNDPAAIVAIAWYMVGQRAQAVSIALRIQALLENTKADQAEVQLNVEKIVGSQKQPLTDQQKTDERNPWMAEVLWHLCLFLSKANQPLRAVGELVALEEVHIGTKDHGPDIVALYKEGDGFGISIVETKAYETNPNKAINDAVDYFREVDGGAHDLRLRQTVSHMRNSLPPESQALISPSLWKMTRTYLPNPHYDDSVEMDWTNTRPSFRTLNGGSKRIVIMPNAIPGFSVFFDAVADQMREIVEKMDYV